MQVQTGPVIINLKMRHPAHRMLKYKSILLSGAKHGKD